MKKTAVITGGSGGLGAAIADILSPEFRIILQYYKAKGAAEDVQRQIAAKKGDISIIQSDLSSEEGCKSFYKTVIQDTDGINVLINNCGGIIRRHSIQEITWDLISKHFQLNAYSTIMMTSLFAENLKSGNDSSVINITSGAVRTGGVTATLYGSAKGAIDAFTRGAAAELAPEIRVNAIAPGIIDTDFHEKDTKIERFEKFKNNTPLKSIGAPCHVAQTVLFLIQNEFITGETIDVNGGLLMR